MFSYLKGSRGREEESLQQISALTTSNKSKVKKKKKKDKKRLLTHAFFGGDWEAAEGSTTGRCGMQDKPHT